MADYQPPFVRAAHGGRTSGTRSPGGSTTYRSVRSRDRGGHCRPVRPLEYLTPNRRCAQSVHKVSANYAPTSLLLPTVSSRPRRTALDKEDYFHHFLENHPVGRIDSIDSREIEIDCNTAIDAGFYTFTFKKTGASVKARYTFTYKWDGNQWLITSHHSSAIPPKE